MREILFRGKRADNGEWIFGDLYTGLNDEIYINTVVQLTANSRCNKQIMIQKETIGQFTGLTDKNGTKIFEGDILRKPTKDKWEELNFVSYEVFFHDNDHCESSIGYQMNRQHFHGSVCGTEEYFRFIPRNTKRFEIIGNIHENKEQC